MTGKIFKFGMKSKFWIGVLLASAVMFLLGIAMTLGGEEEGPDPDLHVFLAVMMSIITVVAAVARVTPMLNLTLGMNRSRRSFLKAMTGLLAVLSLLAGSITLWGNVIMNRISPENFDLHTMLSLTGVDNSFCTGMPGLLISWAFEIVFFFSVTLCAMGIMGLFYKIPPRAGMVLWFAGIIGFNALIWFGDDLKIGMPSGMTARLAMMIGALVTGAVLSVYCYGSCDMRAAQPETV